jgi:myo-inositol 2-dehydrogenase/D-chiro-inositol 1-dehydrogenase
MGRVHLEVARATPGVEPVAVVEPSEATLAAVDTSGLAVHADVDAAVRARNFDAAVIAAPSDLHVDLVARLAEAGVPTLCEKPCGLSAADARTAADIADRAGTPLQIGYWRRFVPALQDVHRRIERGELGDVALVEAWQWDRSAPSPEFRRRSGGIVRDMGVHEIDQIRWLTGQDLEIRACVPSDVVADEAVEGDPESVALLGRLSGGGVAYVSLGRTYVHGDACWLEVIGTTDAARVDFMAGPSGDAVFHEALAAQLTAFARLARGGPGAGATADDAVAALEIHEQVDALAGASG